MLLSNRWVSHDCILFQVFRQVSKHMHFASILCNIMCTLLLPPLLHSLSSRYWSILSGHCWCLPPPRCSQIPLPISVSPLQVSGCFCLQRPAPGIPFPKSVCGLWICFSHKDLHLEFFFQSLSVGSGSTFPRQCLGAYVLIFSELTDGWEEWEPASWFLGKAALRRNLTW